MTFQPDLKPTLASVSQQIAAWRREHKAPTPFPTSVWEQAVQLAKELGVGPTARALKLDYGCLKKRAGGKPASQRARRNTSQESPLFFEFLQPPSPAIASCVLLIDTARGGKVRLEFGPMAPTALAAVVRELGI